jgi:hypothetical protein
MLNYNRTRQRGEKPPFNAEKEVPMNYIPGKDADFNVFFKKICDYVA